jgi:carbonic anhydrase/acetyltransferase-like protein (isoleucine patch superfamily)
MIRSYQGKTPQIAPGAWVDPAATIIGDVTLGEEASLWPGAVLRGDVHFIRVGARSNIQDNSVLHGMKEQFPVILGEGVTVGHGALLHGCVVESRCLIGMGAIILNGARIGEGSIVAAGTLITEGMAVPAGSLVMGHPGKVRRALTAEEQASIDAYASRYVEYKRAYEAERQ